MHPQPFPTPLARIVTVFIACTLCSACIETGGSGSGGSLGAVCERDTQCAAELFCALGGALRGQCTMGCSEAGLCAARFGDDAFCHRSQVCARACGGRVDSCQTGLMCTAVFGDDDGYCKMDRTGEVGDAWLLRCAGDAFGFGSGGAEGSNDSCSFVCAYDEADAKEQLRARNTGNRGGFGPENCEFVDPYGPQTTCTLGDHSDSSPLALCRTYVF